MKPPKNGKYTDVDGHTYQVRTIKRDGRTYRLRDDGYRIHFQILDGGGSNIDPEEWIHWAEYKHCDLPGPAAAIADTFMLKRLERRRPSLAIDHQRTTE